MDEENLRPIGTAGFPDHNPKTIWRSRVSLFKAILFPAKELKPHGQ
jgi:hypothetical protein